MKIEAVKKISELLSERGYWLGHIGNVCASDAKVHEIRFAEGARTSRSDPIHSVSIGIGAASPYFMVVQLDDAMHFEIRRAVIDAVKARILSIEKQVRELGGEFEGIE